MKLRKDYMPENSIYPFMGIDVEIPPTMVDPHYSPDCLNVTLNQGRVEKRRGYSSVGANLGAPIVALVEFADSLGLSHFVALTTTKQYVWNTTTLVWDNITYQSGGVDQDWTGTEDYPISYAVVMSTEGKYLLFTNGKDLPRKWDGQTSKVELWQPNIENFVTCGTITTYMSHVVMGNVTTNIDEPQAVYWSETGSMNNWIDDSQGSGANILTESVGTIRRILALGDRMVIYSDDSITMMSYVGGDAIFSFETVLKQLRLVSGRSIVDVGPYHLIMTKENIYGFEGTRMLIPMGDKVAKLYRSDLAFSDRARGWAELIRMQNMVVFHIPTSSTDGKTYVLDYDVLDKANNKWTIFEFAEDQACFGFFTSQQDVTWDGPQFDTAWENVELSWAELSNRAGYPLQVHGTSAGDVFVQDGFSRTDATVAVQCYWTSMTFTVPVAYQSELGRWVELELELAGTNVKVEILDQDSGQVIDLGSLSLTSTSTSYQLPFDLCSKQAAVRIGCNGNLDWFELRWMRVWIQSAGRA